MKRVLRTSQFNDYIAVDIQDEKGKIISTPLYLAKDKPVTAKSFDQEEGKFFKTELTYDGIRILARDTDIKSPVHGMQWDVPFEELVDKNQWEFLNNSPVS